MTPTKKLTTEEINKLFNRHVKKHGVKAVNRKAFANRIASGMDHEKAVNTEKQRNKIKTGAKAKKAVVAKEKKISWKEKHENMQACFVFSLLVNVAFVIAYLVK